MHYLENREGRFINKGNYYLEKDRETQKIFQQMENETVGGFQYQLGEGILYYKGRIIWASIVSSRQLSYNTYMIAC